MRTIFELFARSPFEPLTRHAEQVREVVEETRPLVEAFLREDWEEVKEIHERISLLEHRADEIKHEIRDHLPKSVFLPVDRGDLLRFLKEQDAIADAVEDLAVLMSMRETRGPEALKPEFRKFADVILVALDTWFEVASALPELQEASFSGPEVKRVQETIQDLSTQEWEADKVQAELARIIVNHEDELGAVSLMFWMRISGKLGGMANHAENTADLIRLMLARA